ncbi:MAG: J domain-containing protein [Phycisphaerae bacterium]|nr:J domain-containing protein [Phycisphaerae bacterium]
MAEIRKRYRQLALAYHPDRHGNNSELQTRKFAAVLSAYEGILKSRAAAERDQTYGACRACGVAGALVPRLDGKLVCRDCLLRPRGIALLPAPAWVVLRCTFSIGCLVGAVVCLVLHFTTGSLRYGLAAVAGALAGLGVVATLGFRFPIFSARELRKAQNPRTSRPAKRRIR